MTTTNTTPQPCCGPVVARSADARHVTRTVPITLIAMIMAIPGVMSACSRRRPHDERGAISVEQFAWIGIALFLIVAAAVALKIYWGDVSTFVTNSWDSITGQGGS
jgi:hypothetical protein